VTLDALASQLPVLPIVIPLLAGAVLLLLSTRPARRVAGDDAPRASRLATLLSFAALLAVLASAAALCVRTADGSVLAYLSGNWPAPFGIALAVDRLAAMLLLVTAVVAIACQLAAGDGLTARAPRFHALLQFQVAGLDAAFLTADLFNLFVSFEVLLVASYALLLLDGNRAAVRNGLQYVVVNLFASALFLLGAALLYGMLGSLNLADLALRIAATPAADRGLLEAGGLLLLLAFGLKAAALPFGFWLPGTYGAAPAPVAALFALMTKVGIYAILRVGTVVFGTAEGGLGTTIGPTLVVVGLATLALAALGGLGARGLRSLVAWTICGSAGTLLALVGVGAARSLGAALFYLPHASFAAAALMLLGGLVAAARGTPGADEFLARTPLPRAALLGTAFVACALASAGLPPFSGFVAKAILLDAVRSSPFATAIWSVVLLASLGWVIALSRGASAMFWKPLAASADADVRADGARAAASHDMDRDAGPRFIAPGTLAAIALLVAAGLVLVAFAAPLATHFELAGAQLASPVDYRDAVLGRWPVTPGGAPP